MGEIPWGDDGDVILDWIEEQPEVDVWIVENYRVRPTTMRQGHANTWSESHESQIIGAVRSHARRTSAEFVTQEPSLKPVGYGMAGLKYVPHKKRAHIQDAVAHGVYWWMTKGRLRES